METANQNVITFFAPPERSTHQELENQLDVLRRQSFIRTLLDSIPEAVLVLNSNRQVVTANNTVLNLLGIEDDSSLVGLRPGEALDCIHANEMEGGCGTSEFCRNCGAAQAIMACQKTGQGIQECRITRGTENEEQALDLLVWATEINLEGHNFTIFTGKDISHEKRRRFLERIFFHDILNTAGGLRGFAEMLKNEAEGSLRDLADSVYSISDLLIGEISAQRQLMAAEGGDLEVNKSPVDVLHSLREVVERYRLHDVALSREVVMAPDTESVELITDPSLLGRVLGNLVKNALEAIRPGETVTTGCRSKRDSVEIWVHNPGAMVRSVELQVFQRSFSTKGRGRGLGTYSVKLLTERYLGGRTSFETSEENGTIFRIELPLERD